MNIALLSIGNELLSGDTLNTNAAWIGRKVTELGCSVQRQITVPDDESSIVDGLNRLIDSKPNYLIITGGLGQIGSHIAEMILPEPHFSGSWVQRPYSIMIIGLSYQNGSSDLVWISLNPTATRHWFQHWVK